MQGASVQIQTVVYKMDRASLYRSLDSIKNAVRVDRERAGAVGRVSVVHGDASPEAVLTSEDMKTAQRGTLDVSLAADKGRSYFKPEYGTASQAGTSSEAGVQSEETSAQTAAGSELSSIPENISSAPDASDSGADLANTGNDGAEPSSGG